MKHLFKCKSALISINFNRGEKLYIMNVNHKFMGWLRKLERYNTLLSIYYADTFLTAAVNGLLSTLIKQSTYFITHRHKKLNT